LRDRRTSHGNRPPDGGWDETSAAVARGIGCLGDDPREDSIHADDQSRQGSFAFTIRGRYARVEPEERQLTESPDRDASLARPV